MISLLHTLLDLGHMTSQNLGFAHSPGVNVSFGEETITEINLLEIRRRHPDRVKLLTFSKAQESKITGADWEWHIIGRAYTLKMRVQAKRIYKAGAIGNLYQKGKQASKPQIDLLIEDAKHHNLFPAYCFYCSEVQRTYWVKGKSEPDGEPFETGCLLADAEVVKEKSPNKLKDIEVDTVPWHHICAKNKFSTKKDPYLQRLREETPVERYIERFVEEISPSRSDSPDPTGLPTVFDLNFGRKNLSGRRGVFPTSEIVDVETDSESFKDRGIAKLLRIDMRKPDLFAIRR